MEQYVKGFQKIHTSEGVPPATPCNFYLEELKTS